MVKRGKSQADEAFDDARRVESVLQLRVSRDRDHADRRIVITRIGVIARIGIVITRIGIVIAGIADVITPSSPG